MNGIQVHRRADGIVLYRQWMDEALKERLAEAAKRERRTMRSIVELALEEYLDELDRGYEEP